MERSELLAATPLFAGIGKLIERELRRREIPLKPWYITRTVVAIVLILISVCVLAGSSFRPFIYNQF